MPNSGLTQPGPRERVQHAAGIHTTQSDNKIYNKNTHISILQQGCNLKGGLSKKKQSMGTHGEMNPGSAGTVRVEHAPC